MFRHLIVVTSLSLAGCRVTGMRPAPFEAPTPSTTEVMEQVLDATGPLLVERVLSARWAVPLEGLVNLEHPKAVKEGLHDRDEPIEVYFYAVRHPSRGLFLVDSGVQRALRTGDPNVLGAVVESAMNIDSMTVENDLATWLSKQNEPLRGVFVTHLHVDHILGLPDVPDGTQVVVGPGEAESSKFLNMFVQGTTDRALEGLELKSFVRNEVAEPQAGVSAVYDVFGDGSFWALHVPGHTPGSMAFIARTARGPVLMVGDTSHTRWGWENGVEPGEFTEDHAENARSLAALKALSGRHPKMTVYLGHQSFDDAHTPQAAVLSPPQNAPAE